MSDATTPIAGAIPGAVRVPARDVRVGDYVFSTSGRPDRVIRVSSPANNRRRTIITPENLWPLVVAPDETVTIRRGELSR